MNVIIVGGGVSGLASAYFLSKLGIRSTILEKTKRVGGLIETRFVGGCQLEAGPDSYLAAKPAVTELAGELGDLRNEIIGSNDEARRIFIVRNGELHPIPKGMVMIAPSEWPPVLASELFSVKTKLRFLAEAFAPPVIRDRDVPVAQFVREHFADEMLDYVAEPLLAGVYGGDAANLSAESVLPRFIGYERRYGSLIRGVRLERREASGSMFLSFRNGMQSLTDALLAASAESANLLHTAATKVQKEPGAWRVHTNEGSVEADHVVLACPAYAAAELLETSAPELAAELAQIPYSSAILASLVYERSSVSHPLNGFGFLVPRKERRTISAATWIGTKFPSRAPEHLAAFRGFIVDPEAARLIDAQPDAIAELVDADFKRVLPIGSPPIFTSIHHWPKSMPQYLVGHGARRANIQTATRAFPGLHLIGNAYEGVGISDCVRLAKEMAKQIRDAS